MKNIRKCKKCKIEFISPHGNRVYCEECKKNYSKDYNRIPHNKERQKQRQKERQQREK